MLKNSDLIDETRTYRLSSLIELGHRIKDVSDMIGDRSDAAKAAGVSIASLQRYIAGAMPPFDAVVGLASRSGVSLDWFVSGDDLLNSLRTEPRNHQPASCVKETAGVYDAGEYATAPFYNIEASCGHGAWNGEANIINRLAFRRDWLRDEGLDAAHLAAIRARGDSMEPTIQSGDTLLIDMRVTTPRTDGIYIIEQDGGLSAKRIQRAPDGTLYIRSDNPAYLDFTVNKETPINIIGRLAWFGRRMT